MLPAQPALLLAIRGTPRGAPLRSAPVVGADSPFCLPSFCPADPTARPLDVPPILDVLLAALDQSAQQEGSSRTQQHAASTRTGRAKKAQEPAAAAAAAPAKEEEEDESVRSIVGEGLAKLIALHNQYELAASLQACPALPSSLSWALAGRLLRFVHPAHPPFLAG